jgi:hypothetical protein
MNHYKVNTDDHLRFPAIKKSAHGPNTVSYFFFTHTGIYCLTENNDFGISYYFKLPEINMKKETF